MAPPPTGALGRRVLFRIRSPYAFYDARRYLQTWWSGRGAIAQHAVDGWLAGRTYADLDDAERKAMGRRFEEGYRGEFRRANFVEIKTQLGAFFHLD
jgi:hypothetical protein